MMNAENRSDTTVSDSSRQQSVAIIGAGIAGLACGALLTSHGHHVTIFEKGRRPGGRVATRRAGSAIFDHGAQFARARNSGFAVLMQRLQARGLMAPWAAAAPPNRAPAEIVWVGMPGMSALPGAMAADLVISGANLLTERHVAWLHEDNSIRHLPADEARPGSTSEFEGERTAPFDAILLALPAPQAGPLLATRRHPFAARLSDVSLAPCWAVMASFAERIAANDVIRPSDGPLAWIARNSARPGQAAATSDNWVLHAGAPWSRAHLEDEPTSVALALLAAFHQQTGSAVAPIHSVAHRWRYALVEAALGHPFLWDPAAGIGVCGDWCLGPRIEAAFESGEALARSVLDAS